MGNKREIAEGALYQGADESIAYSLDVTNWGSSPSDASVKVYDITDGTAPSDVTSTVMATNEPSVADNVITLSPLSSLTAGKRYRVEIKFTCSGNIFEAYAIIIAD